MSHDELRAERERLKRQVEQLLTERSQPGPEQVEPRQLLEKLQALTEEYDGKLTEAEAQIAELKRELFGPKADRLTPEQQEQLSKLNQDLEAEAQGPAAASDNVLDEDEEDEKKKKGRRATRRGRRHPLPADLETETVTIEPDVKPCPCCGKMPERMGEEVSEEIDFVAKWSGPFRARHG